jgi:hypothetical protein
MAWSARGGGVRRKTRQWLPIRAAGGGSARAGPQRYSPVPSQAARHAAIEQGAAAAGPTRGRTAQSQAAASERRDLRSSCWLRVGQRRSGARSHRRKAGPPVERPDCRRPQSALADPKPPAKLPRSCRSQSVGILTVAVNRPAWACCARAARAPRAGLRGRCLRHGESGGLPTGDTNTPHAGSSNRQRTRC